MSARALSWAILLLLTLLLASFGYAAEEDGPRVAALRVVVKPEDIIRPLRATARSTTTTTTHSTAEVTTSSKTKTSMPTRTMSPSTVTTISKPGEIFSNNSVKQSIIKMKPTNKILNSTTPSLAVTTTRTPKRIAKHSKAKEKARGSPTTLTSPLPTPTIHKKGRNKKKFRPLKKKDPRVANEIADDVKATTKLHVVYPQGSRPFDTDKMTFAQLQNYESRRTSPSSNSVLYTLKGYMVDPTSSTFPPPPRHSVQPPPKGTPLSSTQAANRIGTDKTLTASSSPSRTTAMPSSVLFSTKRELSDKPSMMTSSTKSYLPATPGIKVPKLFKQKFRPTTKSPHVSTSESATTVTDIRMPQVGKILEGETPRKVHATIVVNADDAEMMENPQYVLSGFETEDVDGPGGSFVKHETNRKVSEGDNWNEEMWRWQKEFGETLKIGKGAVKQQQDGRKTSDKIRPPRKVTKTTISHPTLSPRPDHGHEILKTGVTIDEAMQRRGYTLRPTSKEDVVSSPRQSTPKGSLKKFTYQLLTSVTPASVNALDPLEDLVIDEEDLEQTGSNRRHQITGGIVRNPPTNAHVEHPSTVPDEREIAQHITYKILNPPEGIWPFGNSHYSVPEDGHIPYHAIEGFQDLGRYTYRKIEDDLSDTSKASPAFDSKASSRIYSVSPLVTTTMVPTSASVQDGLYHPEQASTINEVFPALGGKIDYMGRAEFGTKLRHKDVTVTKTAPEVTTYRPDYTKDKKYHQLNDIPILAHPDEGGKEGVDHKGRREKFTKLATGSVPAGTRRISESPVLTTTTHSVTTVVSEPPSSVQHFTTTETTQTSADITTTTTHMPPVKELKRPVVKSLPPRRDPKQQYSQQGVYHYQPKPPIVKPNYVRLPGLRPRPNQYQPPFPLPPPAFPRNIIRTANNNQMTIPDLGRKRKKMKERQNNRIFYTTTTEKSSTLPPSGPPDEVQTIGNDLLSSSATNLGIERPKSAPKKKKPQVKYVSKSPGRYKLVTPGSYVQVNLDNNSYGRKKIPAKYHNPQEAQRKVSQSPRPPLPSSHVSTAVPKLKNLPKVINPVGHQIRDFSRPAAFDSAFAEMDKTFKTTFFTTESYGQTKTVPSSQSTVNTKSPSPSPSYIANEFWRTTPPSTPSLSSPQIRTSRRPTRAPEQEPLTFKVTNLATTTPLPPYSPLPTSTSPLPPSPTATLQTTFPPPTTDTTSSPSSPPLPKATIPPISNGFFKTPKGNLRGNDVITAEDYKSTSPHYIRTVSVSSSYRTAATPGPTTTNKRTTKPRKHKGTVSTATTTRAYSHPGGNVHGGFFNWGKKKKNYRKKVKPPPLVSFGRFSNFASGRRRHRPPPPPPPPPPPGPKKPKIKFPSTRIDKEPVLVEAITRGQGTSLGTNGDSKSNEIVTSTEPSTSKRPFPPGRPSKSHRETTNSLTSTTFVSEIPPKSVTLEHLRRFQENGPPKKRKNPKKKKPVVKDPFPMPQFPNPFAGEFSTGGLTSTTTTSTNTRALDSVTERISTTPNEISSGSSSDISQVLMRHGLTIMAGFLSEAGMDEKIREGGPFTIFAPTDKAFNQFLDQLGGVEKGVARLKSSKSEMRRIMQNHVVEGLVFSSDLEDDLVGTTVAGTKLRSNVYNTENEDWKEILVKTINGAVITEVDLESSNGVVHVVDRVVFPPTSGNLVQTLSSDPEQRFTTFLKALKATKLDKELSDYSTGPWTVFAPTNSAFMNLPMSELEELIRDSKKLRELMLDHMVNRTLYSAGLRSHQVVDMASGKRLNLFSRKDRVKIEGAYVENLDISASNGVIQVVETIVEAPNHGRFNGDNLL